MLSLHSKPVTPSKTVLGQVLRAKMAKEQAAEQALVRAYAEFNACCARLKAAQKTLRDHVAWRLQEEQTLYDQVQGEVVRLTQIESINETVAQWRAKDIELEQTIQQEQDKKEEAEKVVVDAKEQRFNAFKAVEKFSELCRQENQALAQEQEHKEEWELEELSRPQPVLL